MNKQRRAQLDDLITRANEIRDELETLMGYEQDAFDNLPESIQYSERGESMQGALDEMQNALDALDEVESALHTARD